MSRNRLGNFQGSEDPAYLTEVDDISGWSKDERFRVWVDIELLDGVGSNLFIGVGLELLNDAELELCGEGEE